ncbi:MAG: RNA polymerase sigma factor [Actinomycetota bacterium]
MPEGPAEEPVLRELFDLHYSRLLKLAHLLRAGRDAEDLVQEAFLRAFKKWRPSSPPETFWPWVRTTLIRLNLDRLRRLRRELLLMERMSRERAREVAAPHEVMGSLRGLTPRQRTAVVLHYFEDLPDSEVAQLMACSPSTVRALLHQARKRLRLDLDQD